MAASAPEGPPSTAGALDAPATSTPHLPGPVTSIPDLPGPATSTPDATPLDAAVSGPVARILARYAAALVAVTVAAVARFALNPLFGPKLPYVTFFAGVILAAYLGGFGPGVFATVIFAIVSVSFILPPVGSMHIGDAADAVGLLLFVLLSLFITTIMTLQRRARASDGGERRGESVGGAGARCS